MSRTKSDAPHMIKHGFAMRPDQMQWLRARMDEGYCASVLVRIGLDMLIQAKKQEQGTKQEVKEDGTDNLLHH